MRLRAQLRRLGSGPLLWVVFTGLGFAGLAAYFTSVGRFTQRHFTYALDDAYIHMAIARNLVESGVWGISPDGFASASSSILWPLALAASYLLLGVNQWSPYLLNLGALALGALAVRQIVRRELDGLPGLQFWSAALFVLPAYFAPVTALYLGGLEHIWHWLAVLLAVDRAALALSDSPTVESEKAAAVTSHLRRALAWAPALTLVRFETMALAPVLSALALLRRRWALGLAYAPLACLPAVVFGLWSLNQGGMFLPNSVVLKASSAARAAGLQGMVAGGIRQAASVWSHELGFLALMATALLTLLWLGWRRRWSVPALTLVAFVAMAVAHSAFAQFGWLYRYEAYLVAWGSYAVLLGLLRIVRDVDLSDPSASSLTRSWRGASARWRAALPLAQQRSPAAQVAGMALALLTLCCLVITGDRLVRRADEAGRTSRKAARNIYEQHYQVARFLQRYYQGASVALHDIGAVSYFPRARIIDLYGLGTNEVARLKIVGPYGREEIERLTRERGVRIAVVNPWWLKRSGGAPGQWIRVARWRIRNNVICASDTVDFYGVGVNEAEPLRAHLAEFARDLPARVEVELSAAIPGQVLSGPRTKTQTLQKTRDQPM